MSAINTLSTLQSSCTKFYVENIQPLYSRYLNDYIQKHHALRPKPTVYLACNDEIWFENFLSHFSDKVLEPFYQQFVQKHYDKFSIFDYEAQGDEKIQVQVLADAQHYNFAQNKNLEINIRLKSGSEVILNPYLPFRFLETMGVGAAARIIYFSLSYEIFKTIYLVKSPDRQCPENFFNVNTKIDEQFLSNVDVFLKVVEFEQLENTSDELLLQMSKNTDHHIKKALIIKDIPANINLTKIFSLQKKLIWRLAKLLDEKSMPQLFFISTAFKNNFNQNDIVRISHNNDFFYSQQKDDLLHYMQTIPLQHLTTWYQRTLEMVNMIEANFANKQRSKSKWGLDHFRKLWSWGRDQNTLQEVKSELTNDIKTMIESFSSSQGETVQDSLG